MIQPYRADIFAVTESVGPHSFHGKTLADYLPDVLGHSLKSMMILGAKNLTRLDATRNEELVRIGHAPMVWPIDESAHGARGYPQW